LDEVIADMEKHGALTDMKKCLQTMNGQFGKKDWSVEFKKGMTYANKQRSGMSTTFAYFEHCNIRAEGFVDPKTGIQDSKMYEEMAKQFKNDPNMKDHMEMFNMMMKAQKSCISKQKAKTLTPKLTLSGELPKKVAGAPKVTEYSKDVMKAVSEIHMCEMHMDGHFKDSGADDKLDDDFMFSIIAHVCKKL